MQISHFGDLLDIIKKSVLEIFPERFELIDEINILFLKNDAFCAKVLVKTRRLPAPTLP